MNEILQGIFTLTIVAAVLGILFTRNIMYAVFGLVVSLISVAGLSVLFAAEFVAVSQLMIYIGGVIVLLLFAVMLTQRIKGKVLQTGIMHRFIAPLAAVVFFSLLAPLLAAFPMRSLNDVPTDPVRALGFRMLTEYLVPVELVAVLLLAVLIGAASIAGRYYTMKGGRR